MLNLALVGLLSGSLLTGSPDGDRDKEKSGAQSPATPSVEASATPADARAITADTYAFGRPADSAPIKLWVAYANGTSEGPYAADGDEDIDYGLAGNSDFTGDITSQRVLVGAQINVINFSAFKFGVGGQLAVASNVFEFDADGSGDDVFGADQLESGFGLQNVKLFASARGRVVGIHGGYILDLYDADSSATTPEFARSDEANAMFFGGDFDYPSERFRLFGGIDYYNIQASEGDPGAESDGANIIAWNAGAGIRFGFVELGAALLIRAQLVRSAVAPLAAFAGGTNESGGHSGSIAPYLKLAPPSIPVSLFIKGAVLNEYDDYGYKLGGANDFKPQFGFTAGLTLGFE